MRDVTIGRGMLNGEAATRRGGPRSVAGKSQHGSEPTTSTDRIEGLHNNKQLSTVLRRSSSMIADPSSNLIGVGSINLG